LNTSERAFSALASLARTFEAFVEPEEESEEEE
jgi:hypothetical protein